MDKVSMSYHVSFSRYQTKCVVKFLFRQLMTSYFKIYIQSSCKAMAGSGENEEKTEMQKFEYLENEKRFLDEIKSIFRSF